MEKIGRRKEKGSPQKLLKVKNIKEAYAHPEWCPFYTKKEGVEKESV